MNASYHTMKKLRVLAVELHAPKIFKTAEPETLCIAPPRSPFLLDYPKVISLLGPMPVPLSHLVHSRLKGYKSASVNGWEKISKRKKVRNVRLWRRKDA